MKYKLYIWKDFCSDWYEGLAVAVAKNIVSAKKVVRKKYGDREPYAWGYLEVYNLDKVKEPFCEFVQGGS